MLRFKELYQKYTTSDCVDIMCCLGFCWPCMCYGVSDGDAQCPWHTPMREVHALNAYYVKR